MLLRNTFLIIRVGKFSLLESIENRNVTKPTHTDGRCTIVTPAAVLQRVCLHWPLQFCFRRDRLEKIIKIIDTAQNDSKEALKTFEIRYIYCYSLPDDCVPVCGNANLCTAVAKVPLQLRKVRGRSKSNVQHWIQLEILLLIVWSDIHLGYGTIFATFWKLIGGSVFTEIITNIAQRNCQTHPAI